MSPKQEKALVDGSSDAMNEDLEKWLKESQDQIPDPNESQEAKNKPKGKCSVCKTQKATDICLKCGKSVCNSHFYHIIGVCEKCLSDDTVEKWKKHNPNWKSLLGVDWVD